MPRIVLALAAALLFMRRRTSQNEVPRFHPTSDAPDPRYALALDEARRKIDYQVRTVEGLRTRSMALAGFTAVSATFFITLAGRLTEDENISWTGWLISGLLFMGLSVVFCVPVLRPRDFRFTVSAVAVIEGIESGMDPHSAVRWLATSEHENSLTNDANLRLMTRSLTGSLALYGVGVVLMLVDLVGRG